MGIIKRVITMLKADVHGVLDLLEDPVDLCNQAIREMESEIEAAREQSSQLKDRHRQILKQREQAEQRLVEIRGQLEVCLGAANRDLAKSFMKRRLECERRLALLTHRGEEAQNEIALSEQRLKDFEEKVAAVRDKLELFAERTPSGDSTTRDGNGASDVWVSDEEVELALRQLEVQSAQNVQG
jgi:phage shock protein A